MTGRRTDSVGSRPFSDRIAESGAWIRARFGFDGFNFDSDDNGVVEVSIEEHRRNDGAQKISPHSVKPRFKLRIVAPFLNLALTIWKNRLASPQEIGRYLISLTTRGESQEHI